jgi:hypothetical protein
MLHGNTSYKYLGYYINTRLNFQTQYKMMHEKLIEACSHFHSRQKNRITLHEAINYVNSDLVSTLRYGMCPAPFINKYLKNSKSPWGPL